VLHVYHKYITLLTPSDSMQNPVTMLQDTNWQCADTSHNITPWHNAVVCIILLGLVHRRYYGSVRWVGYKQLQSTDCSVLATINQPHKHPSQLLVLYYG